MSAAGGSPSAGHPLSWDQLHPYEQQQGGYWLYEQGKVDAYGNGKTWVSVRPPGAVLADRRPAQHCSTCYCGRTP